MTDGVEIREMQENDRPALVGFMAALNDYEMTLSPDRAPGAEMAEGHMAFLLEEVARRGGFTLLAVADGQAIGFLLAYVHTVDEGDIYLREPFRRVGEISDMYVYPAYRGRGLAKAMMAEAEGRFRAMGLSRMEVRFLSANTDAERTYRAAGFRDHESIFIKPI